MAQAKQQSNPLTSYLQEIGIAAQKGVKAGKMISNPKGALKEAAIDAIPLAAKMFSQPAGIQEQPSYPDYYQRRPDAAQRPFPAQGQPPHYQDLYQRRPDLGSHPFPQQDQPQYQDLYQRRPDLGSHPMPQQGYQDYNQRRPDAATHPFPQSEQDTYDLNGNVYKTTPSGIGFPVNGKGLPDVRPAMGKFARDVVNAPQDIISGATGMNTGTPAYDELETMIHGMLGGGEKATQFLNQVLGGASQGAAGAIEGFKDGMIGGAKQGYQQGLIPSQPPEGWDPENPQNPPRKPLLNPYMGSSGSLPPGMQRAEDGTLVPDSYYAPENQNWPRPPDGVTEPGFGIDPATGQPYPQFPVPLKPLGSYNGLQPLAPGEKPQYTNNYEKNYQMYLREMGIPDSPRARMMFSQDLSPDESFPTQQISNFQGSPAQLIPRPAPDYGDDETYSGLFPPARLLKR
jgi:hypothetical protein